MKEEGTKKATKEQLDYLYNNMGETISSMYPSFLKSIILYNKLSSIKADFDNKDLLIYAVRVYYQIIYSYLDIVTIFRSELKAVSTWEKRIQLKYVYVVLTETIKALFGFKVNKQTLWKKFCDNAGGVVEDEDRITINQHIEKFKIKHLNSVTKNFRDYAVHYDCDPLKVYEFWQVLSEQKEIDIINDYYALSLEILSLVEKVFGNNIAVIGCDSLDGPVSPSFAFWEKVNSFSDKDGRLLRRMQIGVETHVTSLDSLVRTYRIPNKAERRCGFDTITMQMRSFLEAFHPVMLLHFIYIDIGCVIIAYLNSKYYIEKQLNLRHLNVIVYEGFKKLYGFGSDLVGENNNTIYNVPRK